MPRKYIAVKTYKTYDTNIINKAVKEVSEGGSLRKVAKKYDIHYSVLFRHVKKGSNLKKRGGQTVLSNDEEQLLVNRLQICSDWGYPIDPITFRLLVKDFLDRQGKNVPRFKDNMPGTDFVYSFLKRHSKQLSARMCQNIKRSRAATNRDTINEYFDQLETELKDVPPSNVVNYDETNLCDDPGRRLIISRRGCKYPERIMNSTKSSISVMFAAAGDGAILPPYVVYKAQHMYDSWRVGGPANSRYNRTKSGWFDAFCFQDWVEQIAIPYFKKLQGPKILIGDNLSSHLSVDVIKICNDEGIKFVFLPANSPHLTQPLDVAFFRPLKKTWRSILENWKKGPGRHEASLAKDKFPPLLKELCASLKEDNVLAGFKKCGIVPLDRKKVLDMLPSAEGTIEGGTDSTSSEQGRQEIVNSLDDSFKQYMEEIRKNDLPKARKKRTKVSVVPGKSVAVSDFPPDETSVPVAGTSGANKGGPENPKKKKKITRDEDDSTSEDSHFSLEESDEDEEFDEVEPADLAQDISESSKLSLHDHVIVKVMGKNKTCYRLYVAKVIEFDEEGYIGRFLKKIAQTNKFRETDEEALFKVDDVVRRLPTPKPCTTSRFKGLLYFEEDLSDFTLH